MKYSNRLFGLNLRRLRDAAGKKQKDIAKLFDSDPVTVSRWETGAMGIDKEKIPKLCEFFGVTESEFYKDPNAAQTLSELATIGPKKLGDMTPEEFEAWESKRRERLSQVEPIPITQKVNHGKDAVDRLRLREAMEKVLKADNKDLLIQLIEALPAADEVALAMARVGILEDEHAFDDFSASELEPLAKTLQVVLKSS